MEYLYGLLFGTEPKQSDADARTALHAKLDALPDDRDAQITLTAAELRILKEATTTTRQKHGGGDELFVRMHSNLTEDLDPSTADAVVDAYGASPLKPNPLAKRRPSPETPQLRKACKNAVADLISERQLASSVPKERRKTLEAALSEVNAWGFDVWSVVDAFQGCVEIKCRAPHAIGDVDSLVDFHTGSRATPYWLVEQSSTPSSSRRGVFGRRRRPPSCARSCPRCWLLIKMSRTTTACTAPTSCRRCTRC